MLTNNNFTVAEQQEEVRATFAAQAIINKQPATTTTQTMSAGTVAVYVATPSVEVKQILDAVAKLKESNLKLKPYGCVY